MALAGVHISPCAVFHSGGKFKALHGSQSGIHVQIIRTAGLQLGLSVEARIMRR